jgi:hypothetical protein
MEIEECLHVVEEHLELGYKNEAQAKWVLEWGKLEDIRKQVFKLFKLTGNEEVGCLIVRDRRNQGELDALRFEVQERKLRERLTATTIEAKPK